MPAYLLVDCTVTDPARYENYRKLAAVRDRQVRRPLPCARWRDDPAGRRLAARSHRGSRVPGRGDGEAVLRVAGIRRGARRTRRRRDHGHDRRGGAQCLMQGTTPRGINFSGRTRESDGRAGRPGNEGRAAPRIRTPGCRRHRAPARPDRANPRAGASAAPTRGPVAPAGKEIGRRSHCFRQRKPGVTASVCARSPDQAAMAATSSLSQAGDSWTWRRAADSVLVERRLELGVGHRRFLVRVASY